MHLTILGQVPSLKNSKQLYINKRTGKSFITSSKASKLWVESALWQLKGKKPVTDYPAAVTMVFTFKGQHRKDLDNATSSVLDVLKMAGIIEDDDWKHIDRMTAQFGSVNKENPGVDIYFDA